MNAIPDNTDAPQAGLPLGLFGREARIGEDVQAQLKARTFVGIDFGTSTTVASRIALDPVSGALVATPIPVRQYDELGICTEDALVPTCLAWTGQDLLAGQGAARLKTRPGYEFEKNIWFSFKMRLGVDLGPQYYRTELPRGGAGPVLETPRDAAALFFRYLREQITRFVAENNLPPEIVYAVSVPAAFEANQRQDLCLALKEAGIELPDRAIIDEPNAAFTSYLLETLKTGAGIARSLRERKRNVLVFDFGAGTCDISILEVAADGERFTSKNLALSQFHALGGDDIDRHIARQALLGQLAIEDGSAAEFTSAELDSLLIPRLQPAAESLKIQCCKFIAANWNGASLDAFLAQDALVTGSAVAPFPAGHKTVRLDKPSLSHAAFARLLAPFLDPLPAEDNSGRAEGQAISIFEPIGNALEKAELAPDALDMILLVGGSSLNPFVQQALKRHFGRFVECVELSDLRTPVSRGAAIYSFMVNGLRGEFIRPITSESIYVVTRNGELRLLLPAGSAIPSGDIAVTNLVVTRDRQAKVELPICVTSGDKLLGVIEVPAPEDRPFKAGETLQLTCRLDANKLLHIRAGIGGRVMTGALLNPLSNKALSACDRRMLAARLKVNLSALENKGRPSFGSMLCYAYACAAAGQPLKAAESFAAAEQLAPPASCDFAVSICYHYSKAGKEALSDKWAGIAFQRNPTPVSAFNLALARQRQADWTGYESLMKQSLNLDPEYPIALEAYGDYLNRKGDPLGIDMVGRAFDRLHQAFLRGELHRENHSRLRRAARTLGRQDIVATLDACTKAPDAPERPYCEENLLAPADAADSVQDLGGAP